MTLAPIKIIEPRWDAPRQVRAICTTRQGGFSKSPFDSLNLAAHVGDAPADLIRNRRHLGEALNLPAEPDWLQQTHSTSVVTLEQDSLRQADAAITRRPDTVAVVMTADCLPILLCNREGSEVAAIHAGWRGLVNGVVQATLTQMNSPPEQLLAWIGPAISQSHFEVGPEVHAAFVTQHDSAKDRFVSNRPGHWICDLAGLAADSLNRLGLIDVHRSEYCSYADADLFFSYRRNPETGRMASLIWIDGALEK